MIIWEWHKALVWEAKMLMEKKYIPMTGQETWAHLKNLKQNLMKKQKSVNQTILYIKKKIQRMIL